MTTTPDPLPSPQGEARTLLEILDELGVTEGATLASVQRRLNVGAADGMRLLALRYAALASAPPVATPEIDPTQAHDPHVDRLVALIEKSLALGGCSNCGGLPHTTTCRVGRLQRAFDDAHAKRLASSSPVVSEGARKELIKAVMWLESFYSYTNTGVPSLGTSEEWHAVKSAALSSGAQEQGKG